MGMFFKIGCTLSYTTLWLDTRPCLVGPVDDQNWVWWVRLGTRPWFNGSSGPGMVGDLTWFSWQLSYSEAREGGARENMPLIHVPHPLMKT